MKIKVDRSRCQGHATCILAAPEVYRLNDDGFNDMEPFTPPPELENAARKGALACPERAIIVVEDEG
ncbi:MAG: ferredoxin [Steroidobacteraceae bacterium]